MDIDTLSARESIRETIGRYAHYVDSGRFDRLVGLFARDGVLEVERAVVARGRDELRAFFAGVGTDVAAADATGVPHIRHHVSNVIIDIESPTSATASCYFLCVTDHGPDHWGRYRDQFVARGRDWQFARRSVRTDGAVPGGFGATHSP